MPCDRVSRYDYFKAELLKTGYFHDNIACHFTASFAAVGLSLRPFDTAANIRWDRVPWQPRSAPQRMLSRFVDRRQARDDLRCVISSPVYLTEPNHELLRERRACLSAALPQRVADTVPSQSTIQAIKSAIEKEGATFMFKGWVPA